jgi:hypothetical protein
MSATRNLATRLLALTDWLNEHGDALDFLHVNRSEILAEAGPIAFGFQSDYTGRIDRQIFRLTASVTAAIAYRDRRFPIQGPPAPEVEVTGFDPDWPF